MTVAADVSRPLLRYHGGKWRLAPWVIEHMPEHRVYLEPFGGGGSVLLRKPATYSETYNDIDDEIVNVFEVARDPAGALELERLLRLTPFARREYENARIPCDDPVERARRTIVCSFMGYGSASIWAPSGFRRISNRQGTSQAAEWCNYAPCFPEFTKRLQRVVIERTDAIELLNDPQYDRPDGLIYCDPPYLPETRKERMAHGKGYRHELKNEGHDALIERLRAIGSAMVMLSGYPSALYDDALVGWRRVERDARTLYNLPRTEVLWLNPRAVDALGSERLALW